MCVKHLGKNAGENLKSKFSISHAYFWSLDGKIIGGIYDNRFLVKNVKSAREKMPEAELKILQQNFLEKCSEFTEQKNRLLKFIVVVSVLAFFLSIGITMYAVSQPDSISGLVTMNDFGETQYIGPVSRKTIKTLMFQNLTDLLVRIARTNWSYKHIVI